MKLKDFFKRGFKYIRELSIVIIGIAITIGANNRIILNSAKKDLQRYLDAVHLEMDMNNDLTKILLKNYTAIEACSSYLNSEKTGHYNVDSLNKHKSAFIATIPIQYSTSSFEMLKNSGLMRLIKDDVFFKSIISCYRDLNTIENIQNTLSKTRTDIHYKMINDSPDYNYPLDGLIENYTDPLYKPLYLFMTFIQADAGYMVWLCSNSIEQTSTLFPEKYR